MLMLAGCAAGLPKTTSDTGEPASESEQIAKMQIVDCLLPGQLRRLGDTTYMTQRRPIKTTAADCNIRGGEYTAYDRADYKTALKVWLPEAKAGDAEAQVNVGEIFEKGLGSEPNYEAAVIWYEKAAKQGNERGLFNLGTMYEQGKGVEESRVKALNLYRQAWGLSEDSVIFQETARAEQRKLEAKLSKQLEQKQSQIRALQRQIESLQGKLEARSRAAQTSAEDRQAMAAEIQSLKDVVSSLNDSRDEVEQQLASLEDEAAKANAEPEPSQQVADASSSGPAAEADTGAAKMREPASADAETADQADGASGAPAGIRVDDMDFGQYYALVIGNRDYVSIQDLDTPITDAQAIASLLESKYGFQVERLIDADRLTIMKTINSLHGKLDDNDNLLIYYAGHGSLVDLGQRDVGYWLPTNADPPPDDSRWVPNEFITGHLGRFNAKRVLVIADSCYGGLLSSAPGHLMLGDNTKDAGREYMRYKLPRRSRLLLSSGGDKPVIDSVGDEHSIFAGELIKTLRSNQEIMTVAELFETLNSAVSQRARASNISQQPELKSIKGAGHEVGDFFFVPQQVSSPVAQR
ncbi:caspase family protein [Salinisphaera sp. P385]|uniref:Caspase family protein n=1 Tax=Spectribacter acetivorans TaxID=3075603 RepID=A0ABU3B8J7_9GAMM|nr:caspase family protein [Salinisphaera sp. P385]MDT0618799.1 caspase family protein [Salinisphaera sp. P385]